MDYYTIRIAILGDSISEGLGNKKYNYVNELKNNIEKELKVKCDIFNFSYTGKTIKYANEIKEKIKEVNPDIIINFFGNVDGMVRPKKKQPIWNIIPKRYKGNGMLDPRPFYSSNKLRSLLEHTDSFIRFRLKIFLMKTCGTYSWVEVEEFEDEYRSFIDFFDINQKMLLVSTVYIDDYFFPGTNKNYNKYNKCIYNLAQEYELNFIDLRPIQKKFRWNELYNKDHFHPNREGYTWYAKIFTNEIKKMIYK